MKIDHFKSLVKKFKNLGCERLFIKHLSTNDNSKQQVYLGQSFEVLNAFHGEIIRKEGAVRETWRTEINFNWMNEGGDYSRAPHAKRDSISEVP